MSKNIMSWFKPRSSVSGSEDADYAKAVEKIAKNAAEKICAEMKRLRQFEDFGEFRDSDFDKKELADIADVEDPIKGKGKKALDRYIDFRLNQNEATDVTDVKKINGKIDGRPRRKIKERTKRSSGKIKGTE